MMRIWRSLRLFFLTHWRGLSMTVLVVVGLYILLNFSFMLVSGNDQVCVSCHVMSPYERTWQHSSHAEVACISCHDLEFGYFTSALVKSATGLYNPRLRAQVENRSCLQSGCHSLDVVERASGFGSNVAFDHKTHLTQMRRGEKLRCTSCHTGDQEGKEHFTTSANTCYICHFKGAEQGRSVTQCTTCHTKPPEQVSHSGFTFNHSSYLKLGVSCEECHVQIVSGDASVDKSRCNDCHVERLEKFDNFAVMHDKHVTEQGIGCFRCHGQIEHRSIKFVSTLDVTCQNCHSELHSPQKQMYMGVGGKGLADVPSRMFAAKVSCEGCHVPSPAAPGGLQKTALDVRRESCVRCHEKGYDAMLDDWLKQVKTAMDYVAPMEQRGRQLLQHIDATNPKVSEVAEFINDALANIDLVRAGKGVHNVEYAVKLINTAADQLTFAFKRYGEPLRFGGKPAVLQQPDGYCGALCHDRLAKHKVVFFQEMEVDFDHSFHEHVSCTTCHSASKHKERVISKDGCMNCHHTEEAQEAYGAGCEDCHSNEASFYRGTVKVPGLEIEPDVMAQADAGCLDCHKVQAQTENLNDILARCNDCHESYGAEPNPVNDWFVQKEVASRQATDKMLVRIATLKETLRRSGSKAQQDRLAEAEKYLDIVLRARPHHNMAAAEQIIGKVEGMLVDLEKTAGR